MTTAYNRGHYSIIILAFFLVFFVGYVGMAFAQDGESDALRLESETGIKIRSGTTDRVKIEIKSSTDSDADDAGKKEEVDDDGRSDRSDSIDDDSDDDEEGRLDDNDNDSEENKSDLDFLRERARIRIKQSDVNKWDDSEKQKFLGTVKTWAEVQSGQELEHFAQGVLLTDKEVSTVSAGGTEVTVQRRTPAKFLGIFKAKIKQEARVTFGDGERGARVKTKFPWYRFLFSSNIKQEAFEEQLHNDLQAFVGNDEIRREDESKKAGVIKIIVDAFVALDTSSETSDGSNADTE